MKHTEKISKRRKWVAVIEEEEEIEREDKKIRS